MPRRPILIACQPRFADNSPKIQALSSKARRTMNKSDRALKTVASGLGMVYAGLCLLVFSALWPVFGGFIGKLLAAPLGQDGAILFVVVTTPLLIILAMILDTAGRLFCLAVPDDGSPARPIVYVSVAFSVLALVIAALQVVNLLFARGRLIPPIVGVMQTPFALIG